MSCYPDAVILTALGEIGYKEKASNSQLDNPTANAGAANYTKYADYIDQQVPNWYNFPKNGFDWCDVFVDWCYIKTYGAADAKRLLCNQDKGLGAGCKYSAAYFQAAGRLKAAPELGAQIFFLVGGAVNHTGIVVSYDQTTVTVVEGNSSNAVVKRTYQRSDKSIYGYGCPSFDTAPVTAAKLPVYTLKIDPAKYSAVHIELV